MQCRRGHQRGRHASTVWAGLDRDPGDIPSSFACAPSWAVSAGSMGGWIDRGRGVRPGASAADGERLGFRL
eukprot:2169704-Pyramimonas_sp.AAC.1